MEARTRELDDDRKKLAAAKAAVEQATGRLREGKMRVDKGELEIKRRDDEITKNTVALNSVKTNEEFAVLKGQIWPMSGTTPYARFGNLPLLSLLVLSILAGFPCAYKAS